MFFGKKEIHAYFFMIDNKIRETRKILRFINYGIIFTIFHISKERRISSHIATSLDSKAIFNLNLFVFSPGTEKG